MREIQREVEDIQGILSSKRTVNILWILLLILLLCLLLLCTEEVMAITVGGELHVNTGCMVFQDEVAATFGGYGEMEFFLPSSSTTSSRLVLTAHLSGEDVKMGIKYLYLRYGIGSTQLTMGRQPISWSYGSMMNYSGYRLGIDGLPIEYSTPGVDGLCYCYFFGDGKSLQLITSFPSHTPLQLHELGYGARLRIPGHRYDLSYNLSYQPIGDDTLLRGGLTYKGSLYTSGLYGLLGYYSFLEERREDYLLQIGLDYSWPLGAYGKRNLFLQAEYARFIEGEIDFWELASLLTDGESDLYLALPDTLRGRDLLAIHLSMAYDYFTTFGLLSLVHPVYGTGAFLPYYTSDLGRGLEMSISGSLFTDREDLYPGIRVGLRYFY